MPNHSAAAQMQHGGIQQIPLIKSKDVKMGEPLGTGTFGIVHKGDWKDAGGSSKPVAVKTIKLEMMKTLDNPRAAIQMFHDEAARSYSLRHENIVPVYGRMDLPNGDPAIVMEYADGGDLSQEKMKSLWTIGNQRALRKMSLGLVSGLEYLHSRKVVHRDLKPANVLCFGREPVLKISDFGLSRAIAHSQKSMTSLCGTPLYWPPEIFEAVYVTFEAPRYTKSVDVYSLALVLFQIHSGGLDPYNGEGNIYKAKLTGMAPVFPPDYPDDIKEVVTRGYSKDPSERPTFAEFRKALG